MAVSGFESALAAQKSVSRAIGTKRCVNVSHHAEQRQAHARYSLCLAMSRRLADVLNNGGDAPAIQTRRRYLGVQQVEAPPPVRVRWKLELEGYLADLALPPAEKAQQLVKA